MNVVVVMNRSIDGLFFMSNGNSTTGVYWQRTGFESIAHMLLEMAHDSYYLENKLDFTDTKGETVTVFTFLKHN